MRESDRDGRYGISRTLEAADREIRRRRLEAEDESQSAPAGGVADRHFKGERLHQDAATDDSLLENSLRFERAPWSTHAKLLLGDGISLPAPERLARGDEVGAKLWEVINALAVRRVFIRHTNHLTNRELYAALWSVHLNDRTRDLSDCPGSACYIDLLESGAEGERCLYLRYYADAGERKFWEQDLTNGEIPEPCSAPYDRDRHLPKQGQW